MRDDILVSVIVTTFNRKELLRDTINSILRQTYNNFELIVVDNYSNYDFESFIQSFRSSKIKAFQNQNNGVIAVNRNFGLKQAKGDYIAFCDDDDIWLPNKLEKQIECFHERDVEIISSSLIIFGDDIEKEYLFSRKYKNNFELFFENFFTPSSVIIKNPKCVFFCESKDFICAEDWCFFLELILRGYRYYQLDTPLIKYRFFASNMTKKNRINVQMQHVNVLKYLKKKYKKDFLTKYFVVGVGYQYFKYIVRLLFSPFLPVRNYIKRNIVKK